MPAHAIQRPEATHDFDAQPILIIDDEISLAEELSEAMALQGYSCLVAQSEERAMQLFLDNPDIEHVVVDFYLRGAPGAGRNGLDVIDRLRELAPARNFDCVVISGDPEIVFDCTMSGVTKFLPKPVHPDALSAMLRRPGQTPVNPTEVSTSKLQRRVAQQSEAIANLSRKIAESAERASDAAHEVTLLTSAACLLRDITSTAEQQEIRDLAQYIVDLSTSTRLSAAYPTRATTHRVGPSAFRPILVT
jgi:response regulator RpfG family c-di-GMP phosphodiesterase